MGKWSLNTMALRKIGDALESIDSPFTSIDMASLTGLETKRVAALLRQFDNIERIPINRKDGLRVLYKVMSN